jgi:hypothetical protein
MKISHPALVTLLQKAYSGEMAAAFAYVGHAGSLKCPDAKAAVKQIENDEWNHRKNIRGLMLEYDIPVSRYYETYFYIIGKVISLSCHVIGWFMPYFFAGKLESGNVCEYFVMMRYFQSLGIKDHDEILYEMGMKEKEHEIYFLEQIKSSPLLPLFQKLFSWGPESAINDVDFQNKYPVQDSHNYCKKYKAHKDTNQSQ